LINDFASRSAWSMKSRAAGVTVRFFRQVIAMGPGWTDSFTGRILRGVTPLHNALLASGDFVCVLPRSLLKFVPGVTGPRRVAALRDIPTVAEAGFPDLIVEDWVGFAVKAGTPRSVTTALNLAINDVLKAPAVRTQMAKLGADPAGGTPAEFGDLIKSEVARWSRVVREADIRVAN
jgi:hypothetical protein